MPRIFDNINSIFAPALTESLSKSFRSDFCVGYLNLRGWKKVSSEIDKFDGGEGKQCRVLIGMQSLPHDMLRDTLESGPDFFQMDRPRAQRVRTRLVKQFAEQLTFGTPSNDDEKHLRILKDQLIENKVRVKIFLRHQLHAKLYLSFREDRDNPITAYLGSSNLSLAGLAKQGELNTDILDHDATQKLADWFERFWNDSFCVDITDALIKVLEEGWPGEELIPPYQIYLKAAYHLSREAREGIDEFRLTADFEKDLLNFQKDAVKVAAQYLNTQGGVMIGDVVGLGKSYMATALAKMFEKDTGLRTLIICPAGLVKMWEKYIERYQLHARVVSIGKLDYLEDRPRYGVVIIDESHNLRNREGQRYRKIEAFIKDIDCKVVLLSATPYNKALTDLGNQLRLFKNPHEELSVCPENYIRSLGQGAFLSRYQVPTHSLAAFEKSEDMDDWRELMRLFLIRRTRDYIKRNYATYDEAKDQHYITLPNGDLNYFPKRVPKTVKYELGDGSENDILARMYSDNTVDVINGLNLPRYGLAQYIKDVDDVTRTKDEQKKIDDLSRAGRRLLGFCRTNLFKRLESSGDAFLLSIKRHIIRNYMFGYALSIGKPLPVKTDGLNLDMLEESDQEELAFDDFEDLSEAPKLEALGQKAFDAYYAKNKSKNIWLRAELFGPDLQKDLTADTERLIDLMDDFSEFGLAKDRKLDALLELLQGECKGQKVLIFSQFSDTVKYLERGLKENNISHVAAVTGGSGDVLEKVSRFSPVSNEAKVDGPETEVLIATDVLSEGQNLQDSHIVINYDLPWAIIRLIQRAGRVDRIGQESDKIKCYSFLPAEGVERVIRLRGRVLQRLSQNARVIGTDERFFEDERNIEALQDIYSEKANIFDDDETEVDPVSHAYEIWNAATKDNAELKEVVENLPDSSFSAKATRDNQSPGVIAYLKTKTGATVLSYRNMEDGIISNSPKRILDEMACEPEEPALERHEKHHDLVSSIVQKATEDKKFMAGNLGRPGSIRRRVYERMKAYIADHKSGSLLVSKELEKAVEDVLLYPMTERARSSLGRQMRAGANDVDLAKIVVRYYDDGQLVIENRGEKKVWDRKRIICSLGLVGA